MLPSRQEPFLRGVKTLPARDRPRGLRLVLAGAHPFPVSHPQIAPTFLRRGETLGPLVRLP